MKGKMLQLEGNHPIGVRTKEIELKLELSPSL